VSGYQSPAAPEGAAGPRLCGVPMIHKDGSESPCTQPYRHFVQIEDSDHVDEHGCLAPVLVHQSTIREVQAVQRWRNEHPDEP
jgi:hypothetical protein